METEIQRIGELPTKEELARALKNNELPVKFCYPREGYFSTSFNETESRVEVHFKPRGEDPILCLASYKPRGEEFRKRLTKSGFDIQYFEFFEDIHSFAVLCKKAGK
jgi:hypothetical protein